MCKLLRLLVMVLMVPVLLAGCLAPGAESVEPRVPTDAEVEQYNASVAPAERIVCRREIPVGSNIPKRLCRLVKDVEEASTFHREQLRRSLR